MAYSVLLAAGNKTASDAEGGQAGLVDCQGAYHGLLAGCGCPPSAPHCCDDTLGAIGQQCIAHDGCSADAKGKRIPRMPWQYSQSFCCVVGEYLGRIHTAAAPAAKAAIGMNGISGF